jgi:hypothetical protein
LHPLLGSEQLHIGPNLIIEILLQSPVKQEITKQTEEPA